MHPCEYVAASKTPSARRVSTAATVGARACAIVFNYRETGVWADLKRQKQETSRRTAHGTGNWRYRAGFRSADDGRQNPLPRLDHGKLGRAVLASQGFHPRVHDRAWLHGEGQ